MCSARRWTESRMRRWHHISHGGKPLPCRTFIPGVEEQVVGWARALLAALVGDGEEGGGRHGLGAAAVVAAPLGPAGGLRVGAARAAASLSQRRRRAVAIWDVLGLSRKCFTCVCFGHWFWNSPRKARKVQPSPVAEDSEVRKPLLVALTIETQASAWPCGSRAVSPPPPAAGHRVAERASELPGLWHAADARNNTELFHITCSLRLSKWSRHTIINEEKPRWKPKLHEKERRGAVWASDTWWSAAPAHCLLKPCSQRNPPEGENGSSEQC